MNRPEQRLLEPEQVELILTSPLSSGKLSSKLGISPQAVRNVRNGMSYKDLFPDLPRHRQATCFTCIHWLKKCTLGLPEAKSKDGRAASLCAYYQ